MRTVFVGLLSLHAVIHLMGFAKAFGYAELKSLTRPIPKPLGLAWLSACLLLLASASGLAFQASWWAPLCVVSLAVSQAVLFSAWTDAKYGTVANVLILALWLVRGRLML